jgi:periplasmic divalent cation tolerance protein
MAKYIQVFTTAETREDAQQIARAVVEQRLAACAQVIGPVASTYWWQGEIQTAGEWMCVLKSRKALYTQLERAILDVHPYDVPEIVATPLIAGSKGYLSWLEAETGGG